MPLRTSGLLSIAIIAALQLLGWRFARALSSNAPTNTSLLPVVVRGADAAPLLGAELHRLSAFTCDAGHARPVVFQADERNADGRVVDYQASSALSRDESPGIFDENDELIFMLREWGEACPEAQLARTQGTLVHLSAAAPYLKEPASLYVLLGERGFVPPRAYVRYEREADLVDTDALQLGYLDGNAAILDHLVMKDLRTRPNKDILDRQKARFRAKALGSLVTLTIDEDDFETTLDAVRVGPVRVVRETSVLVSPAPGLTVRAFVTYYHYERIWRGDIRVYFPKAAALFVSSMDMIATVDFTDQYGLRIYTAEVPDGVLIDGKMIDQERSLAVGKEPWYFVIGDGLNQLGVLDLDKDMDVVPTARFIDDADHAYPPEEFPGAVPEAGYELLGWENVQARWYHFEVNIVTYPGFPERGATGAYRSLRTPPVVTVALKRRTTAR